MNKSDWQPIDTVPYGEIILVSAKRGTEAAFRVAGYPFDHWKRCLSCNTKVAIISPTHWMPLPEPPE